MKKRGDRAMSELYDRTQKIPRLKVEGSSCKEPLDHPVDESGGINENKKSPSRKRSFQDDDNPFTKPESGTCNVCNTPCSSCLHRMRVETDTCSFVGACSEHLHCENAETISKLRNPNKPKPFDVGIVKQEGQGESTSCLTNDRKQKDTRRLDSHKESNSNNREEEAQGKKRFNSTDSQEKSDSNFRVSEKNPVLSKKMSGGLENCDTRDTLEKDRKQVHKVVEVKNQETDNGLIDVNVCDICGDTGREELLATCSRCIDGAEHTYCMRVRLEKLPEGDWLCEECQLKDKADKEKQRQRHTQTTPLSTPLSEKENKSDFMISKNPFSRHKKLRISTDRAVYASVPPPSPRKSFKELISPGKSSNLTREKLVKTETCSSKEVMSPRKYSNLSRENSMKMEICSPKDSNKGQIMKKSHALSRSYSLSTFSSLRDVEKDQLEMPPPKGKMTKHLSFKNPSMKPKVKSMAESIPTKEKPSGFSLLKPTDEARPFRRLIKSASLKEGSSGRANSDSLKLAKPSSPTVHISPPKSSEMSREREKISLEKKNFKGENRTNVLAQQPGTVVKRIESKAERSIPKKPEYGASFSQMEPAAGDKKTSKSVLTKQHQANKDPRSVLSPKERDKKFNKLKTAVKSVVPEARNGEKSENFNKPKLPILKSGVSYTSKNQKTICSNIGEDSRSTFSDKSKTEKAPRDLVLAASSLKKEELVDLDVISPRIGVEKIKLPKDMLSRSSSLDKEKTLDTDVITTAVGVDKTKTKVMLSRSSSLDEGTNRGDINVITTSVRVDKIKAPKDILSQARTLEKPMDSNGIPSGSEFKMTKATMETLTDSNAVSVDVKHVEVTASIPVIYDSSSQGTPLKALSIPEQDSVWQGSFEIMRGGAQGWESFDGIQAHFSTHISPKVFDAVAKFSDKLQLEEVPWSTAWPGQFQEIKPSEEHVALFFFARDLKSYEVSYGRLLRSLIAHNLALRGNICGVELLIFPSDKLPEQSQRWNSLFYLWGIFCARKQAPPETSLKFPKPIGGPSGNFPTKINEDVKSSKEINIIDNLPKLKVEDVPDSLDVGPMPCKKTGEQDPFTRLDPSAFCAHQEAQNASRPACTKQSFAVKAENANEMAEIVSDDKVIHKTLSLEKPTDAKLKPGNGGAYLSDGTSSDELDLKRKRDYDDSHIEIPHKRSTLLNKLVSPKIHPLSIDLEKPAETCDLYSTEDVEGTGVGDVGQSKLGNNLVNVISSDDVDVAHKMPNLNLALGNKNPWQKEVLPLPLFPLVQAKEEESDASLSLSLTIAPPGWEEGVERPAGKMQQFLPEKPGVKEPLRLFGQSLNE